jgi:hypothetical protein
VASVFVNNLNALMVKLQAQADTLANQIVLVDHSLDGQSFNPNTALIANLKAQKELADLIRNQTGYELRTRVLVN